MEDAKIMELKPRERLLIQGTVQSEMFLILDGKLRVEKRDEYGSKINLALLSPYNVVGEVSALTAEPRQADVVSETASKVLMISGVDLKKSLSKNETLLDEFMKRISKTQAVSSSRLFSYLPIDSLKEVVEIAESIKMNQGEDVIREGENAKDIYLIKEGVLEAFRENKKLGVLKSRDTFGEIALMRGVPRSATIRCVSNNASLLKIPAEPFLDILEKNVDLALALESQADFRSEAWL